ncbi:MAG TPA: ATP-binding protein [Gammaproteobacteria bacterium]|nr:ATP-binding protein [Gammaproteobacteria bacterium]
MSESKRSVAGLDPVSRERMDAVSDLVRRVSHEYNNLFGIVIATLGILKDDIEEHPGVSQLKPLISDALSASKEGTDLMERLLACTGDHLLQPEPVDVTEVLDKLKSRLRQVLPGEIALEVAAEPDLPRAYVDPAALEGALDGLVENAREAMPVGGTLSVSAARYEHADGGEAPDGNLAPGHYLSISVSDTGNGIDPSLLKRVVEPFVTTKEPAKSRGFGLSRSYGFAKQSCGQLVLDSAPNRGTKVTLVVPMAGPHGG